MKVRPSHTCCGCVSLTIGVEAICLLTLLTCISIISSVSSKGTLEISTFHLSSTMQVVLGSWAFVGIPMAISSGVSVLYRTEFPLRIFFFYLLISFFFGVGIPLWFLASGSLCDTIVTPEVQKMGSSFVCGFTDTFTFFWTLIFGVLHAYLIYVVWSAAEEISEAPYPELMKYSDALKNVYQPDAPANYSYPLGNNRGAAMAEGAMDPGMMGRSFGTFAPGAGGGMPPTSGMMPGMMPGQMSMGMGGGMPQGFIPGPGASFR